MTDPTLSEEVKQAVREARARMHDLVVADRFRSGEFDCTLLKGWFVAAAAALSVRPAQEGEIGEVVARLDDKYADARTYIRDWTPDGVQDYIFALRQHIASLTTERDEARADQAKLDLVLQVLGMQDTEDDPAEECRVILERVETVRGFLRQETTRAEASEKEVAKLREALKPFAKEADEWNDIPGVVRTHDDVELWQQPTHGTKLSVGDLRRAREALTALEALPASPPSGWQTIESAPVAWRWRMPEDDKWQISDTPNLRDRGLPPTTASRAIVEPLYAGEPLPAPPKGV